MGERRKEKGERRKEKGERIFLFLTPFFLLLATSSCNIIHQAPYFTPTSF